MSLSAVVGIVALVCGIGGYLRKPTRFAERVVLIVAGLLLLTPGYVSDAVGVALFFAAWALQVFRHERLGQPGAAA